MVGGGVRVAEGEDGRTGSGPGVTERNPSCAAGRTKKATPRNKREFERKECWAFHPREQPRELPIGWTTRNWEKGGGGSGDTDSHNGARGNGGTEQRE